MKKFQLFCLSAYLFLLAPDALHADGIAVIAHADIKPYHTAITAFREQVKLPVHEYYLGTKHEYSAEVKTAIRQQQPTLIFALGKSALNFSRETYSGIPIIFAFVLHPESPQVQKTESGIAMLIEPEQQLKVLFKIKPTTKSVAVVYNPAKSAGIIRQVKYAAKKMGVRLVLKPVDNQAAAASAIAVVMPEVDAMWMVPDTTVLTSTTLKQMVRLSITYHVVLIGLADKHVRAGSLFALSFDSQAIGLQAGRMSNRMLKGKKMPKLVPPNLFKLTLNTQTANRLNLHIPAALLAKAANIYPKKHGLQ